ncbi:MAG: hypothetical protein K2K37_13200, partial [Muribaculaceae bacterium]|nr:hypothetical protein [Muribaculaceae bacterium]
LSYNMGVLIYAIVLMAVFAATIYAIYAEKKPLLVKTGVLLTLMLSGLTFMTDSILVWVLLIAAAAAYLFFFCPKIPYRIFSVGMLSIFVIFVGYSSYALLLIRASANTPMNQNAPDNVFTLSSYLNREQYGKTPLLYGPVFAEELAIRQVPVSEDQTVVIVQFDRDGKLMTRAADVTMRDNTGMAIDNGKFNYVKKAKTSPDEPDEYVKESYSLDYETSPDVNMLFTRMHSSQPDHIQGYKDWSGYQNDIDMITRIVPPQTYAEWQDQGYAPLYELAPYLPNQQDIGTYEGSLGRDKSVWKPSMADNLRYFFNYQLNHMYWRYFMWNFAGRQNDIQGNGEPHLGNWISGIPFIDNMRLGDQSLLPDEYGAGNKGHNVFYMLPLLLGLIGLLWQSLYRHPVNTGRGIEQFWVVFFLFFMTGVAIVLYLNQTPGQPRERDYAFAGSFYAFAIWIGMGVPAIAALIRSFFAKMKKENKMEQYTAATVACVIGIAVPLQMVSQTWDDHDRSHRYTTRDFGANYLNSLDPDAIIFTNGDNDTFPLWYAQEVEGVRTDVRVVNLSYLATDWYANQMTHPYYDAPAVKFTARPTDYAYDRLAYSLTNNKVDTAVVALDALKEFYDTPGIDYGKQPIKVLETQLMYSPVDTAQVFEAFGLNANSTDSITKIPYISDITMNGLDGGGFTLSKLLSFDIVANSVADGFKRPVYFATTVPESFYLGLRPYFGLTGMAYQVTPFENAPASPLADKAYENFVSRFKWGGLDDTRYNKNLYLDETIRRMVASTRNSMVQTAEDLMVNGDLPATEFAVEWAKQNSQPVPATRYDMARNLLNLMEEKLPDYVAPYDGTSEVLTVIDYLQLYDETGNPDDLARAERLIDSAIDRYAQLSRYALSMSPTSLSNMGYTGSMARYYLPMYIGFKNYVLLSRELSKDADANAETIDALKYMVSPEMRLVTYPMLYLLGAGSDRIEELADVFGHSVIQGADLADIHKSTGIDQMKVTNEVMSKYGLDANSLLSLNQYSAYMR